MNELELRKKPSFALMEIFTAYQLVCFWVGGDALQPFQLGCVPLMAEKRQMLQPFLAVESGLLHIHSTVFQRDISYPWKEEQLGI